MHMSSCELICTHVHVHRCALCLDSGCDGQPRLCASALMGGECRQSTDPQFPCSLTCCLATVPLLSCRYAATCEELGAVSMHLVQQFASQTSARARSPPTCMQSNTSHSPIPGSSSAKGSGLAGGFGLIPCVDPAQASLLPQPWCSSMLEGLYSRPCVDLDTALLLCRCGDVEHGLSKFCWQTLVHGVPCQSHACWVRMELHPCHNGCCFQPHLHLLLVLLPQLNHMINSTAHSHAHFLVYLLPTGKPG